MKWGTRYGPEYVNRLYAMARRHTTGDIRFVCFTDDGSGIVPDVEIQPLPDFPGVPDHLAVKPWRKLSLWQKKLANMQGDALFLDLDVIITGSLDEFFTYEPGKFCVIHNWTQPTQKVGNTSVFRFPIGKYPHIYDDFVANPEGIYQKYRIEQQYISGELPVGAQVFWPGSWCRSFKEELLPPLPLRWWQTPQLPADARIVVFHGKPDPDEAAVGQWPVKKAWKKIYKTVRPTPWITQHWQ